jgi:hypothetical protein
MGRKEERAFLMQFSLIAAHARNDVVGKMKPAQRD